MLVGFFFLQKIGIKKTSDTANSNKVYHKQEIEVKSVQAEENRDLAIAEKANGLQKFPDKIIETSATDNGAELGADFEELMTGLLIADEAGRRKAVAKVLDIIRANLGEIETMQGGVEVRINEEAPVVNAGFYVSRKDRDDAESTSMPFQYSVKVEDKEKGLNLLSLDPHNIRPEVWFDGGSESQSLPPMLTLQLPNILIAPISAILGAYKEGGRLQDTQKGFLHDRILTISKSNAQQEKELDGGPFWIVQTAGQGTLWLSEKGDLYRLVKSKGKNELDISYSKYELIDGVRYPTEINIHLAMDGPRGEQFVKAFTGKNMQEARIKFSLKDAAINNQIDESKFQRNEE